METFDVWQFIKGGTTEKVGDHLSAREATLLAKSYCFRPAAALGIIQKVMITDRDDYCVFLWEKGEVVFPKPEAKP